METVSLSTEADSQLAAAHASTAGRAAHTLYGGSGHQLRQALLALAAGRGLDDHESPGEATLLVVRGRIRLSTADDTVEAGPGDYLVIPGERHNVLALEDAVFLLTVVPR